MSSPNRRQRRALLGFCTGNRGRRGDPAPTPRQTALRAASGPPPAGRLPTPPAGRWSCPRPASGAVPAECAPGQRGGPDGRRSLKLPHFLGRELHPLQETHLLSQTTVARHRASFHLTPALSGHPEAGHSMWHTRSPAGRAKRRSRSLPVRGRDVATKQRFRAPWCYPVPLSARRPG